MQVILNGDGIGHGGLARGGKRLKEEVREIRRVPGREHSQVGAGRHFELPWTLLHVQEGKGALLIIFNVHGLLID